MLSRAMFLDNLRLKLQKRAVLEEHLKIKMLLDFKRKATVGQKNVF